MGRSSENNCVAELAEVSHEFGAVYEQSASGYTLLEDSVGRLALKLSGERFQRSPDRDENYQLVARLERVLDTVPVGLVVLDGVGVVRQCNAMAVELFGSPLLGVLWREVISRVFGTTVPGEIARLRDGRRVTISGAPLGAEPAQIILLQHVPELHTVHETRYRRQRLASMGKMAASLAQQLHEPLTSSLLYVAKLKRGSLSEEERARYIHYINSSLNEVERTVAQTLVLSWRGRFKLENIRVSALLADVRNLLKVQARRRLFRLSVVNRAPRTVVSGSRDAILAVIQNLVENLFEVFRGTTHARSRNRPIPRVIAHTTYCTVTKRDNYIEIRIGNKRPGIPATKSSQILRPFHAAKDNDIGLGLMVAEELVKFHSGTLWLDTGSQAGATTFVVRLPIKCAGTRRPVSLKRLRISPPEIS
jgi:two-component system sensor histidine kinase FlrB